METVRTGNFPSRPLSVRPHCAAGLVIWEKRFSRSTNARGSKPYSSSLLLPLHFFSATFLDVQLAFTLLRLLHQVSWFCRFKILFFLWVLFFFFFFFFGTVFVGGGLSWNLDVCVCFLGCKEASNFPRTWDEWKRRRKSREPFAASWNFPRIVDALIAIAWYDNFSNFFQSHFVVVVVVAAASSFQIIHRALKKKDKKKKKKIEIENLVGDTVNVYQIQT